MASGKETRLDPDTLSSQPLVKFAFYILLTAKISMASSLMTEHKSTHCFEVSSVGGRDAPCLDKFAVRVQRVGVGSSFFSPLRVNIIVCADPCGSETLDLWPR